MQVKGVNRSVVIVGCARDCEAFLPAVLQNISRIATLYSDAAFVFVENDSRDNTREILQRWLNERASSFLVCLDGLAAQEKRRTARLAIARNAYMEALHYHHLAKLDHLLVLDFDIVNTDLISEESLAEAIRFLDSSSQNAAVFANQLPYYDIWALRHDVWCPDDCWAQIANRPPYFPRHRAIERYFTSRQVRISPDSPPVAVRSAFGGLGIYKLDFVRGARYLGLLPDGSETCEHVAFNEAAARMGGLLYIYPRLLTHAPPEHIHPRFSGLWRLAADLDPRSYPLVRLYKRLLMQKRRR
jgi:mannosyltransferase 1 (CAP59)